MDKFVFLVMQEYRGAPRMFQRAGFLKNLYPVALKLIVVVYLKWFLFFGHLSIIDQFFIGLFDLKGAINLKFSLWPKKL